MFYFWVKVLMLVGVKSKLLEIVNYKVSGQVIQMIMKPYHMWMEVYDMTDATYQYTFYDFDTDSNCLLVNSTEKFVMGSWFMSEASNLSLYAYSYNMGQLTHIFTTYSFSVSLQKNFIMMDQGETIGDFYACVRHQVDIVDFWSYGQFQTAYQVEGSCHSLLYKDAELYVATIDGSQARLYVLDPVLNVLREFSVQYTHVCSFAVSENSTQVILTSDYHLYIYNNTEEGELLHHHELDERILSSSFTGEDIILQTSDTTLIHYHPELSLIKHNISINVSHQKSFPNGSILVDKGQGHLAIFEVSGNLVCQGGCVRCPFNYTLTPQQQCQYSLSNKSKDSPTIIQSSSYPNITKAIVLTGRVLVISSWRVSVKFVVPLIWMLQEMWFYKFHQVEYPEFMQYFMENVDLLNYYRLKPDFINLDDVEIHVLNDTAENQVYFNMREFHYANEEKKVYFLHSTKDIYVWNLALNLVVFLGLFIVYLVLKGLVKIFGCRSLRVLADQVRMRLKWWIFVLMMLDSNALRVVFYASSQLLQPYCLNFINKVNLVMAVMAGFVVMISSVVLLPMLYQYAKKKVVQPILNFSNYELPSFVLEMVLVLWRNVLRGFFHSYLTENYYYQILCLTGVDAFSVLVVIYFKKKFVNRFTFFIYLLYALNFLLFDLTLFLRFEEIQFPFNVTYDVLVTGQILSILGLVGLKVLIGLYEMIKGIWQVCRTNRIHPNLKQPKKQQKQLPKKDQNTDLEKIQDENKQQIKIKIQKSLQVQTVISDKNKKSFSLQRPFQVFLFEKNTNQVQKKRLKTHKKMKRKRKNREKKIEEQI